MKPENAGGLVVLEGPDGTGKTTLAEALVAELSRSKIVKHHSFPGTGHRSLGKLVYRLHHDPELFDTEKPTPAGLQALHIAAHLDAIERTLLPALRAGDWVVLDRFWWSTVVYGRVSGVDSRILNALIHAEQLAWGDWKPRAVFHVTCSIPYKDEQKDSWARLLEEYQKIARDEATNYPVYSITNTGTAQSAVKQMVDALGAEEC